jgi:hypothetical protein
MGARATWICARATRRGARASDVCKGHIFCLYTKILMINSIICLTIERIWSAIKTTLFYYSDILVLTKKVKMGKM